MKEKNIMIKNLFFPPIYKKINMNINLNKINIISGPNNSGKSTLIKILNKKHPYMGEIIINDKNINDYKVDEYYKIMKTITSEDISFTCETLEDEVTYYINNINDNKYKELVKKLKLTKYKKSILKNLDIQLKIKVKILLYLLSNPDILIIEDLSLFFTLKEIKEIIELLKWYQEEQDITIIITTTDLDMSLYGDYLYILADGNIVLEGSPIEVLQNDNIINRIGLTVPFMVDLSVKLRDYDLIKEIELDMNRMVDELWKWYLMIIYINQKQLI